MRELVSLHLTDQERIKACLQKQGQVILALMACNLMWGTRSSGWYATACPKKSSWHVHYSAAPRVTSRRGSQEVKQLLEPLKVPIKGIISDGQETIRSAVAFVFPDVPHQLCQFHYLNDAIK